jgi:hypothetical protein
MNFVRIVLMDFILMAVYFLFPVKIMGVVVSKLSLPASFISDYNYIHHLAILVLAVLFFFIFFSNVICLSTSQSSFSDGPDYIEMIKHTIKETIQFSILIVAFCFISYLLDDEAVKEMRAIGTITIIGFMYFISISRLFSSFMKKVISRIFKR